MNDDTVPALDTLRHAAQLALLDADTELGTGSLDGLPWSAADLAALRDDDPAVTMTIGSGLTAVVRRVEDRAPEVRRWTLKQARAESLVRNLDGRTSFLNEVQRRIDIEALKRAPGGRERWRGLVDTRHASLRHGVILSPWIEGAPIPADGWDERRLSQVLGTLGALWLEGLFEWDPSNGNLLDDGAQVRLFDFGYCYRFDPLRHFNTAGRGDDQPMFHPAERFETRTYCAVLLTLEAGAGPDAALAAFRREKAVALEVYRGLRETVAARGAQPHVTAWLAAIIARWAAALAPGADLGRLYLAENWRSHALDLDDDLRGRTCTPMTLRRADWLLAAIDAHFDALRADAALFHGDEALDRAALRERYAARRAEAATLQVHGTATR
jgi:hypothetical protein